MHEQLEKQNFLSRGNIIHQYVRALQQEDVQAANEIIDSVCDDPELQSIITEINFDYQQQDEFAIITREVQPVKTNIRVAIFEGNDLFRVGLRATLLQNPEIQIVGEADDAYGGSKIVKYVQPDIAIVDTALPDNNGIELIRYIKSSLPKDNSTKVLTLAMRDRKEDVLAALVAGADSYCLKDIKYNRLLEAVCATHNGILWIDPAIVPVFLEQVQIHLAQSANPIKSAFPNSIDILDTEVANFFTLSDRELDVLQLIVEGFNNAAIAEQLYISIGTVKSHVRSILFKLNADDRTQAAICALRRGLVQ
ncbi:MAG: response regulator transcription factor [Calothrix sp. CSU_2_0]|nr:response regulator transcription factor [Calothrix sp. CSU_2_0]